VSISKYSGSHIVGKYLTNYGGVLKFRLFALITSISISSFYRILISWKGNLYFS